MTKLRKPWIVQRAGHPGHYRAGWFAMDWVGDSGAWFPTWREAFDFALERTRGADGALTRALAQWGVRRIDRAEAQVERATDSRLNAIAAGAGDQGSTKGEGEAVEQPTPRPTSGGKIDLARLISMHATGMVDRQIATHFGCSVALVALRRNQIGLAPNGQGRPKRSA